MFQFSLGGYFRFLSRKSIGSNFRACLHAHKYSQKFDMLACIHTKWASSFSRVVIFVGGNFRIFSRPGINFRYVSIFAWWLFSFFSPENPLEVIFAPVYMLISIVRNLTY